MMSFPFVHSITRDRAALHQRYTSISKESTRSDNWSSIDLGSGEVLISVGNIESLERNRQWIE